MKNEQLPVIGKTEDGKPVVGGVFEMFDTHGLPFTVIFMLCDKLGVIPCWLTLYNVADAHGWSHDTIMKRLTEAIQDVYPMEWGKVVIQRLDDYGKKY